MNSDKLRPVLEALFAAADKPLSVNQIFELFVGDIDQPGKDDIRQAILELVEQYQNNGIELKQVASGFRFQIRSDYETWVTRLWEQKPPRYSRALMETLALIAYRQPITRGEIEDIRGVSVSTNIIKTLQEREWVKSLGHKEVPGRPTLYGTTREFLDYFNLKSLNQLPTLAEIRDIDQFNPEFQFDENGVMTPKAIDTPEAETDTSEAETDTPEAEKDTSEAETDTSEAETDTPEAETDTSETKSV
jgi:segregation and condensation protein B